MIASISGPLLIAIALAASVITIVAGIAVWSVFRGSRSQFLSEAQATSLDALDKELNAYKAKADRLESENEHKTQLLHQQDKRLNAQQNQINHLQELVTQTAKVDALTAEIEAAFIHLGVPREVLMTAAKRRSTDI